MTGGGITLTQLFKGWPPDQIAVLSESGSFPRKEVCDNYYHIGSLEDRWMWPLSYIRRSEDKKSGPIEVDIGTPPEVLEAQKNREDIQSLTHRGFHCSLRLLGVQEILRRWHTSSQLLDWIEAFRPDILYTQLSDLNLMRLVGQILRIMPIPLVLHFMDDWPATMYRQGLLSVLVRSTANRHLLQLVQSAAVCMGISEFMCKVYSQRYGREFHPFHNIIEWELWEPRARKQWSAGSPFTLLYRGRIGTANSQSVMDIADAVRILQSSGKKVQFAIFTPDLQVATKLGLMEHPAVTLLSAVPYAELPAALSTADVLVLPLDFDPRSRAFAQYSMPTKVPEYMACGVPVLVYAPARHAVSLYAKEKRWGYVITRRDIQSLQSAILRLMDDQALRTSLGTTAKSVARENHDAGRVRERFRQLLASAADGS